MIAKPPSEIPASESAPVDTAAAARRKYTAPPGSAAESRLVEEHLHLVKHVVGRLMTSLPPHIDVQDLYSSGLVGLLQAFRQFNPEAGSSFESYARVRIRGAILDEMRRMDWVPRSIHEKARKVQMAMDRLEQANGRVATDNEVAAALDMSMSDYEELMAEIRPATFLCLDAAVNGEDGSEVCRHEVIPDDVNRTPDENADRNELARIIAERLERLPEMQRKVLALYYFEDMRLREIAEAFGVTESRICQIHSQAILAIKNYLAQKTSLSSVPTRRAA